MVIMIIPMIHDQLKSENNAKVRTYIHLPFSYDFHSYHILFPFLLLCFDIWVEYRIGPQIGVGAHGEVRCGYDYSSSEHIAIKIVETQRYDAGTQARIQKEIELLHMLNNENSKDYIIQMRDVFDNVPYIGTWCNGCGCTQFIQKRNIDSPDLQTLHETMKCHLQVPLNLARYNNDDNNNNNKNNNNSNMNNNNSNNKLNYNENQNESKIKSDGNGNNYNYNLNSNVNSKNGAISHSGSGRKNINSANKKDGFLSVNGTKLRKRKVNDSGGGNSSDDDNLSDAKSIGSSDFGNNIDINDNIDENESEIEFDFHCEMPYYEYYSNAIGSSEVELNEIQSAMKHENTQIVRLTNNSHNNGTICHYCQLHSGNDHTVPMEKEVTLITQDLAYGGELFSMLRFCGKFDESMARHYFRQIIFALDHLHSRGVYHRDLKVE